MAAEEPQGRLAGRDAARGAVPRWLLLVAMTGVLVATAMTFIGGWTTGVSWDEPVHVQRLDNYLHSGWYVADFQSEAGVPLPDVSDQYVYGPAAMLLFHEVNLLAGIDGPGTVSTTATAYAVRHLGVAFLALLCAVAVAAIVRRLVRRWDWGVVAMAALGAVPMWTGHAMFNVKDVPVAAGYTWVTLGLVIAARESRRDRWRWLGPVLIAAGATLAVGTRPGMWAAIAAAIGVFVGGSLILDRGIRWFRYREAGLGLATALVALLLIYPHVFSHPIEMVMRSTGASVDYAGQSASYFIVWENVPLLLPVLILVLAVWGTLVGAWTVLRHLRRPRSSDVGLALVGAQLFVLPVVTTFHHSGLVNDLRQLLFAVPAVAVFIAVAIAWLVVPERSRAVRRLASVVPALALVLPLLTQAAVFPYNYAQRSVLADVVSYSQGWSPDYWRMSVRELAPQIPPTGEVICNPVWTADGLALRAGRAAGTTDCTTAELSPLSMYAGTMAGVQPPLKPTEFWAVVRTWPEAPRWPPNCTRVAVVSRHLLWQELDMSELMRCDLAYPTLSLSPVYFDVDDSWAYLGQGWWFRIDDHAPSSGSTATLAFAIDPSLVGRHLSLVLTSDRPVGTVLATVDGAETNVDQPNSQTVVVSVSGPTADYTPESPLRVTLSTSDGSPLLMDLTSMRLERS